MKIYDIAVVGAGPAGCMASIQAAKQSRKVILLERNEEIGHKLLLTGNGRCNITNNSSLKVFLEKFGRRGSFYRDVFSAFSNHDLLEFFKENDLKMKVEEEGRVFPITEKAESVNHVLKKVLKKYGVDIVCNYRLNHLNKISKIFKLFSEDNQLITARKVILATGGVTYGFTGSTGDGLDIAKLLGHNITKLKPGIVSLKVREEWIHKLKGVTLKDVGLTIVYGSKKIALPRGDLLLTHFGISGPVILDKSHDIINLWKEHGDLKLYIDFKPEEKRESLEGELIKNFQNNSKKILKNYLKKHLPNRTIEPILKTIALDPHKQLNQVTKQERLKLQEALKALPLTVTGHLPLDKAMVTCGGVDRKEINPKTMESKLVNGLYFAGEIISGCGGRGGYNLQQAFSTGYVAGYSAALHDK